MLLSMYENAYEGKNHLTIRRYGSAYVSTYIYYSLGKKLNKLHNNPLKFVQKSFDSEYVVRKTLRYTSYIYNTISFCFAQQNKKKNL